MVSMAWLGYIAVKDPARSMIVFPTLSTVGDFNREKLQPMIDESPVVNRAIRLSSRRSAQGSTLLSKRFTGGSITLTGANSTADLRSKTIKYMACDEIDEWDLDLAGQGNPMKMVDARQISFHDLGTWKKLQASTPTIKDQSRIDDAFEAGDQRNWQVPCPHCGERQRLEFGTKGDNYGLKFNKEWPFNAHYVCRHNGCIIEHHEKREMVRADIWIPENAGPGIQPSFHLDALTSLVTTWDKIAEAFVEVKDDPQELKTFYNLTLGQSWEDRGEAPEWKILLLRREDYPLRQVPPGALVITVACDVQMDGIYYETVAWGPNRETWSIDFGFLEGKTADIDDPVWTEKMLELYERTYPDAYGSEWPLDAMAVDSGYNSHIVYDWCRRHPKAMAIKGEDGWFHAPIAKAPSLKDINLNGKTIKRGAKLWAIGTWPLKSAFYANLRKEGRKDGAELDPPGYCHYSEQHDERYFRQATAGYLRESKVKGKIKKFWDHRGHNHWHDCRIYNMGLADHLGLTRMTEDDWIDLAVARGVPEDRQAALFPTNLVPVKPKFKAETLLKRLKRLNS